MPGKVGTKWDERREEKKGDVSIAFHWKVNSGQEVGMQPGQNRA